MKVHLERVISSKCHKWVHHIIAQRGECTIRNCVHRNHTALQLKLKKNSYTIIMQLSLWKHWELINKLSCQKINQLYYSCRTPLLHEQDFLRSGFNSPEEIMFIFILHFEVYSQNVVLVFKLVAKLCICDTLSSQIYYHSQTLKPNFLLAQNTIAKFVILNSSVRANSAIHWKKPQPKCHKNLPSVIINLVIKFLIIAK